MKHTLLFYLLICGSLVLGQPLQNINYNYHYDPSLPFSFAMKVAHYSKDSLSVSYQLTLSDSSARIEDYQISWEQYSSVSSKEGLLIYPAHNFQRLKGRINGLFKLAVTDDVLAAKIISLSTKTAWYYFKPIQLNTYNEGHVYAGQKLVDQGYASLGSRLQFKAVTPTFKALYYSENFPPATPAFAEAQTPVSATLSIDSVINISGNEIQPTANGLYLIQSDTSAARGTAFLISDDYPKFRKLENLIDPLTYITTKNEFDRLKNAKSDKKTFDKIIIGITGNTERAKYFMKNYYRRVELANRYFTSYKEGWKTDRGMIYIIFGLPTYVYKFYDREVWEYNTLLNEKISFTFVRSSSIFDPDNFVLVRKKSYTDPWLQTVDLIRYTRF